MNTIHNKVNYILVAGVSGCGKTTLAKALADKLQFEFIEADDFHSVAAKQKMADGQPLTDQDRLPWLQVLNKQLKQHTNAILACSALKPEYRDVLSDEINLAVIWLDISPSLATERVGSRENHFMPTSLIDSQFSIARIPDDALILSANNDLTDLISQTLVWLQQQ